MIAWAIQSRVTSLNMIQAGRQLRDNQQKSGRKMNEISPKKRAIASIRSRLIPTFADDGTR
jgi:hypothetical protein